MSELKLRCFAARDKNNNSYGFVVFLGDGYPLMKGEEYDDINDCRRQILSSLWDAFDQFYKDMGVTITGFIEPYREGDHLADLEQDIIEVLGEDYAPEASWDIPIPKDIYEKLVQKEVKLGLQDLNPKKMAVAADALREVLESKASEEGKDDPSYILTTSSTSFMAAVSKMKFAEPVAKEPASVPGGEPFWITQSAAARLIGVSRQNIWRLAKDGRIPSAEVDGVTVVQRDAVLAHKVKKYTYKKKPHVEA